MQATAGTGGKGAPDRWLQMLVDVFQGQAFGEHQNLQVVQQLGNFLGRRFIGFIFGGHPYFGCFLNDLLADAMDTGVQFSDGAGAFRAGGCLLAQFSEQRLEILHTLQPTCCGTKGACPALA